MTLHRITILCSCAILSVLGTACDLGEKSIGNDTGADQGEMGDGDGDNGDGDGDGDPGDGDGDGDPTGQGDGDCGEETVTIIDDPNATLPGFDGVVADYLGMIEGTFVGQFEWLPNDGPTMIEHAGTMSPLTVTVSHDGGEIRLTEVELVGEFPNGNNGGVPCSNILEIDVTLGFATEDGLFAETFMVPISISSVTDDQFPSLPGIYFPLDMAALDGSLALDDFAFEDGEITDLVLTGNFEGNAVSGGLMMEVLFMDWVGFGSVAGFEATRTP